MLKINEIYLSYNNWIKSIVLSCCLLLLQQSIFAKNYLLISETSTCDNLDISILNKEIKNLCNSGAIKSSKLCTKNKERDNGCNTIKCFLAEKDILDSSVCDINAVTPGFIDKWKNIASISTKQSFSTFDCRTSDNAAVCSDLNINTPYCDATSGECSSCVNLGSNLFCQGLNNNTPICEDSSGLCKSCVNIGSDSYCANSDTSNPLCDENTGSCKSCANLGGNAYCMSNYNNKSLCDSSVGLCKSCETLGGNEYCLGLNNNRELCHEPTGNCIPSSSCLNLGGNNFCANKDANKPNCDKYSNECKSCIDIGGHEFCKNLGETNTESCYPSGECGPKLTECPCFTFESLKSNWQDKPDTSINNDNPSIIHTLKKFELTLNNNDFSSELSLSGFGLPVEYAKVLKSTTGDISVTDRYFPGQLYLSSNLEHCTGWIKSPFQAYNYLKDDIKALDANYNREDLNSYPMNVYEKVEGQDNTKPNKSCQYDIIMFYNWLQKTSNNP